ncbi:MAG: site-2 protease family protein [DPANN group archaeon]|nr:site-2 protease family protein [DPANN group archaeon]
MDNYQSLIILLALFFIIWIVDGKNFKRTGLLFLRRTDRGLEFVDNLAKKYNRFFKVFADIGIMISLGVFGIWYVLKEQKNRKYIMYSAIAFLVLYPVFSTVMSGFVLIATVLFGVSGSMFYYLLSNSVSVFTMPKLLAPLQLVLPVQVSGAPIFYVPITYWLISIFFLVVVHELAHAIIARVENVRVKSMGYGFFAVLPLGFAEPDEVQLSKKSSLTKSRIFAAGSFSNFIFAGLSLFLLLISVMSYSLFFTADIGINYSGLMDDTQAFGILPESGTILSVNGINITTLNDFITIINSNDGVLSVDVDGTIYDLSATDIIDSYEQYPSFVQAVDFKLSGTECVVENQTITSRYLGITGVSMGILTKYNLPSVISSGFETFYPYLVELFLWLFMLNLGVGLFNLLPMGPLDGGLLAKEAIGSTGFKYSGKIAYILTFITFFLVLFTLFGPYFVESGVNLICGF